MIKKIIGMCKKYLSTSAPLASVEQDTGEEGGGYAVPQDVINNTSEVRRTENGCHTDSLSY